ncbi:hypothetical protein THII_0855 [Thioploca ingrica]|uniref:Type II secretion system protein GspC N-terminal domain-containing protein n=1 Tax=Thioploca ingrica TaxID=40754 RepID=A0A090AIE2_9GAMM|nr:hypothetical protein THII_0855 [Thioploca ingrica]
MIKHIIFLIGLNGLTGALALEFITIPSVVSVPVQEDHWNPLQLPTLPNTQTWVTQLNELSLWEKKTTQLMELSTQSKSSLTTKIGNEFKFVGIIQQGYKSYILLLDNNKKISSYFINSHLPNGALLRTIHDDTIEVVHEGKIQLIKLYE